ncbi:MAG: hypothetical protein KGI59_03075 [Patescibacteria group bacterium]|nr:hypothetical protein [Patescibacteria group bacterium]MDE2172791.1 hypothetical protein [Patescibacteria group bacterium]
MIFRRIIVAYLPYAILGTILSFTVYAVVQQNIRMSANDPQIQLAEDGAAAISNGASAQNIVGSGRVDMQKSLAPFVIVYDDSGKVLASSGYIGNDIPLLPTGVLDYTRSNIDDRITWQPASTTRLAAVIRRVSGGTPGFVLAGRNIREIESREHQLLLMVAAAWIGLLVLGFIAIAYQVASDMKEVDLEIDL